MTSPFWPLNLQKNPDTVLPFLSHYKAACFITRLVPVSLAEAAAVLGIDSYKD
jgi:hypothetical protein